jgi:hypothetical protein
VEKIDQLTQEALGSREAIIEIETTGAQRRGLLLPEGAQIIID